MTHTSARFASIPFRSLIRRGSATLAIALVLRLGAAPASAAGAEAAEIDLSWHAPWGSPDATEIAVADCDTSHADTLWLSFLPTTAHPTFEAIEATLLFHPSPGETLSGWWYEYAGQIPDGTPTHMRMDFGAQPDLDYPQAFQSFGAGGWRWDRMGPDARLRLIYAVPAVEARGIKRQRYVLGRIIVRHPPDSVTACRQAVCIEWSDSRFSYYTTEYEKIREGPHRFVSLNSQDGAIMTPYRRAAHVRGWRPKN